MHKTILITGATDGIGRLTAEQLIELGHRVIVHGRSPKKLQALQQALSERAGGQTIEGHLADLSSLTQVERLAIELLERHDHLDVLINNAGVFHTPTTVTADGLDTRFVVNTLAPWWLTQRLLPLLDATGRVLNLSSAAQAPVDLRALRGETTLDDFNAYAQSKLAITMWSRFVADRLGPDGPAVIAINPGSMLGTKMVQEAFGQQGKDVGIGAGILVRAALDPEFAEASGRYFDNDAGRFASPHPDALNSDRIAQVTDAVDALARKLVG